MSKPLAFIIEDDEDTSNIFSAALQTAGFETEAILDGQEAIDRLADESPKLVVLDLHLPHADGREILQSIRANDRLKGIPVILATADQRMATELEGDANIVLIKPISFNQLSILSKRLLSRYVS